MMCQTPGYVAYGGHTASVRSMHSGRGCIWHKEKKIDRASGIKPDT